MPAARPPSLASPWSRALIIGLGASGAAAARLLVAADLEVRGYDQRADISDLPAQMTKFLGAPAPPDAAFADIDLVVLSPGVPPEPFRERASRLCARAAIHGELSLALAVVKAQWPPTPTVLITGTNGKSTVTALTGAMLEEGELSPFVGGNLGTPISELVLAVARGERPLPGSLVLECSSYQLETLRAHPTQVAILLNVAPDHLARYRNMDGYADTKAAVFSGLGEGGLALLDARDAYTARLRPVGAFEVLLVDGEEYPRVDAQQILLSPNHRIPRAQLRIAGRHNAKNALFSALAARHLGVSLDACARALAAFTGLPHRMQLVRELDGIAYYDDSKATNVSAVLASLDGFPRPFVLIAGGQAKGEDLSPLAPLLRRSAKGLVAVGEARDQFVALARDLVPTVAVDDMQEAVARARALAGPGDAVVLSPACASWDMFENFAHRGRVFAQSVLALREERA